MNEFGSGYQISTRLVHIKETSKGRAAKLPRENNFSRLCQWCGTYKLMAIGKAKYSRELSTIQRRMRVIR